jgi:hypothetical protein
MTLGFANANVYYYELDLVTCANGLVMVGVVAEALNGVALGKVGNTVGCASGGWRGVGDGSMHCWGGACATMCTYVRGIVCACDGVCMSGQGW